MSLFTNQYSPRKETKKPKKPTQEHGRESHTGNAVRQAPLKHQDTGYSHLPTACSAKDTASLAMR